MELPETAQIQQIFDNQSIKYIPAEVSREIKALGLANKI